MDMNTILSREVHLRVVAAILEVAEAHLRMEKLILESWRLALKT
jgi:hypothetical protein